MVDMPFYIRNPESDSDWDSYYTCRWELLRKPWDQPRGSEKDDNDADGYHVMVSDQDDNVIGVGRVHFNSPPEAQVRYMAVRESWMEKGIGSLILTKLEQFAKDNGANKIMLYARENAIDFYLKRGYFNQGPAHNLYGEIPHLHMTKTLVSEIDK
jgi:predicted GNAT family N-acyltransferase